MKSIFIWILRITAAVILIQTLFFKFTAADESVYIFTKLGMEPYGRIGSGIVELFAAILILIPGKTVYGAVLAAGTMAGAMASHLLVLGIEVKNDGGELFILAVITFICSIILIYMDRAQIRAILRHKT